MASGPWTDEENDLIVADYFAMLADDIAGRRINGFADLDGLEFVARIDIGSDAMGEDKNEIRAAVTPDHRDYAQVVGTAGHGYQPPAQPAPQQAEPQQPAAPAAPGRPAWAQ